MADLDKLKDHLQLARTIIDERGLYTIWDNVPKGEDPDFKGGSFDEAVRQGVYFKTYDGWTETLEDLFFANKLDYLKFKSKTLTGDGRKISKLPAAVFVRNVEELERILDDPTVLANYELASKQPASWPLVTFKDGVVQQGARQHTFTQPAASTLLEKLWNDRRIESPSGKILSEGEAVNRVLLNKRAKINDHARFTDIVTGIHKSMRSKGISLSVKYPEDVILVVRQSHL